MDRKQMISSVVFFGALWGILEATLGYALQFLPNLISGSVMFPIGAGILYLAYRQTGSPRAMFTVALIAASIRGVNFFMPGLLPIRTYNPMIAIVLQGLAFYAVLPILERKAPWTQLGGLVAASLLWRWAFLGNISINNALTGFEFPQLASLSSMLSFGLSQALLGGVLAFGLYRLVRLMLARASLVHRIPPQLSASLFALALFLTYVTT